jgi:Tol biopolymer transport system component
MVRVHLPLCDHPRGTWVGLLAVLILAAMPLLAASTFSAPAAQTMQPVSYLPLVKMTSPYRIAFSSNRDGNDDLYVMNADGSSQTRLTNHPAHDGGPVWSPDGRLIAFDSGRDGYADIYVMNADGSSQTRLTTDRTRGMWPVWSPDGRQIAFEADRGNWETYVMNADGSGQNNLTKNPGYDGYPAWSPR